MAGVNMTLRIRTQSVWKLKVVGRLGAAYFVADRWIDCVTVARSAEALSGIERERFSWKESTADEATLAMVNGNVWVYRAHWTGRAAGSEPSSLKMNITVLSRGQMTQFKDTGVIHTEHVKT